MTKAEFIEKYAEKTGFTKKDSAMAVEAFFAVVSDAMKNNERILIPGIVKIEPKVTNARTGKNPSTGETIEIPAKKTIKAKFSDKLL